MFLEIQPPSSRQLWPCIRRNRPWRGKKKSCGCVRRIFHCFLDPRRLKTKTECPTNNLHWVFIANLASEFLLQQNISASFNDDWDLENSTAWSRIVALIEIQTGHTPTIPFHLGLERVMPSLIRKHLLSDWGGSSAGKSKCCQARRAEFDDWNPHGRRKGWISATCPLTSTYTQHLTCTHVYTQQVIII